MAPKLSSIVGYLLAIIPAYIFVYSPISRLIFGTLQEEANESIDTSKIDPKLLSLISPDDPLLNCSNPPYDVHILSRAPLVIYIESFLSDDEASHMVEVSEDHYETSTVWNGQVAQVNSSVRVSENALLERDDVVKCVEDRARSFQGWRPNLFIERLRSQRYGVSGHYTHHYDWTGASRRGDRVSTFMVYLDAACTGGGTNFPRLKMPTDEKWCEFIECGGNLEHPGVTFKPIKGNAVFWENLRADGSGYPETWHAGLPVLSGSKVGLNIWSWYQPGGNT